MKQICSGLSTINFQRLTALWPILLKLWQLRIHVVPRLRIGRPNFMLRFIGSRIVESPSGDALSEIRLPAEQARAAFRTRTADVITDHFARCFVIFRRTFCDLESLRRHIENRGVRTAGHLLTIATVTIEHHDRFRADFITNRPAHTSTSKSLHFASS